MYIYLIGDFTLIWQQHQLYMYLVVQSLLVLIVFFFRTSMHPCLTRFLLGCLYISVDRFLHPKYVNF
jgi:hypothetical protein